MNLSRKLPLAESPIIGYLHHAYILSIIGTDDRYLPWYYSNYIQLRFDRSTEDWRHTDYFNFYNYDFAVDQIPALETNRIPYDLLDAAVPDALSFFIHAIDNGYYLYLFTDQFYIPEHPYYRRTHFVHDMFLYGYDQETELFYTRGFDRQNMYRDYTIPFADFMDSYRFAEMELREKQCVYLLRKRDEIPYPFNAALVADLLEEYLSSVDSSYRLATSRPSRDFAYGVETYGSLHGMLNLIREEGHADIRPFHLLWEHKKCMLARIRYMEEQGYLPAEDGLSAAYAKVEESSQAIRYLLMKYSFTQQDGELAKIGRRLDEMADNERSVLGKMLGRLREKYGRGSEPKSRVHVR